VSEADLTTLDVLINSHAELMAAGSTTNGKGRDFTSRAS
jgi:hypothetical protein